MNELAIVLIVLLAAASGVLILALFSARRALDQVRTRAQALSDEAQDLPELELRTERLAALAESAFNALMLVDDDYDVIHMNQAARDMYLGGSTERRFYYGSVMTVTRNLEIDELVTEVLKSHEQITLTIDLLGRPYSIRASFHEIEGDSYVALALEDVSELQKLGRARRDMVANISHELRTPVTSIRLLSDTLLRALPKDSPQRDMVEKIGAETDMLQQMTHELLDLAMIEAGRAEFMFSASSLHGVVEDAAAHFSEQMRRAEITFENRVPAGLLGLIDPAQIGRVINNLLHNSIKFVPEKTGRIIVEAAEGDDGFVRVMVTDNGPGIPAEERERVFERFYRTDRARGPGGTGLGLSVAKHIVAAHNGRIWVEEAPQLPGARIVFTVPPVDD